MRLFVSGTINAKEMILIALVLIKPDLINTDL